MTDLGTILLGSGLAVLTGTVVFSLGQLFLKLALEPAVELRRLIGETDYELTLDARLIANIGASITNESVVNQQRPASDRLRALASQLRAKSRAIPWYRVAAFMRIVPRRTFVLMASSSLIGISNLLLDWNSESNSEANLWVEQARQRLGLDYDKHALATNARRVERSYTEKPRHRNVGDGDS